MPMKITVEMVMKERPCGDYPITMVQELWGDKESLSETEVAALDIPISDRVWPLGRMLGHRDPTRVVARRIARDAIGDRDIPEAYQLWMDSGDEALRSAAWDAAVFSAVRDAVWSDAWAAAWDAARDAVRSAAWEKYLSWMVEFLEAVE
jgi:hypothetical protein